MHIVIDARNRRSSTGRYTDKLIENLQVIDQTNSYTILTAPNDSWSATSKTFKTLQCPYKQFSFNPLEQIGFAWQLYRLKPDLVHFTMTQQPILYFGRIVTTTHDLTMLRFTRPGKLPVWLHNIRMGLYRFMFWWSHKKSNHIIVPSNFVKKDLATYQPFTKNKITVTYEAGESANNQKPQKLKGVESPFIFHVGSPFPHKNIERLLESFSLLKKDHPDIMLVLAGKKEHYFNELMKKIDQHPYKKSIVTPGFIKDSELRWLYNNAACYVSPSLSEGFGLPGLEAMANKCPLVSSRATCLPEIYGNAAKYFDPHDPKDMKLTISEVITSKAVQADLVKKGLKRITQYSWEDTAKKTLKIYQKQETNQ